MAFNITFDFSSMALTLPDQLIFGIAYNTQTSGYSPYNAVGPYNDLNIGLYPTSTVGNNLSAPTAYLYGTNNAAYADNGAGGINVFRYDAGGTHTSIAIEFNVPAPSPASINVTGGGTQSAQVGTQFGNSLQAKVTDASGNPVAGATVTFSAPNSGASATLSATSTTTDSNGLASAMAAANTTAGSYAATANVTGVTRPATFNLTNLTGPAQNIAFVQQPTNTQAGQPINPVVTVSLTDAYNNAIVGTTITLSLPGGIPVTGQTATTGSTGVASFPSLVIQKVGTYQLQATAGSGGLTTLSASFNITAGSASSITAVSGGSQTAGVGTTYASSLKALVQDGFLNPIPGVSVTFAAPSGGASVSFGSSATVTTDANGIATSPTMTANGQVGSFQIMASAAGVRGTATFALTNVAGAANKLAFVQQPTDTAAGANITPAVTVQLEDSFGNAVHTAGITVTLQSNPIMVSGRLRALTSFPPQNTDANGLATFANLSISQAGQYQLLGSAGGVNSATSSLFNVRAGAAANVQATGGTPQSAVILTSFTQPLQATVTDAFSNPVNGVVVTFTTPGTSASATLSAASTSTDANGHAAVSATAGGVAGSYAVTATTVGVSGSANFALTNVAGGVGQIAFVQQPSNAAAGATIAPPVVVKVIDGGGNPVSGTAVTLSLQPNTAPLNGTLTTATDPSGQATFSDLSITTSGSYTLVAAAGTFSTVSSAFTISPTTASVTISVSKGNGQSAAVGSAYGGPLTTLVQDLYGNPLAATPVTFTAPSSGASVTFSGPSTVNTNNNGIATAPTMTANAQTGTFQVMATTSGAPSPALFTLTNVAGTANRLNFVQQPTDTVVGQAITPAVTLQLQDSSGNAVHMAGVAITVQPNAVLQRKSLFSGNATQSTDMNGLAAFTNLSVAQTGAYQLLAGSPGFATATSSTFNVTTGPASSIIASGGTSQSAFVTKAFASPLQTTVTDAAGNPVSGVQVVFAAPTTGSSGTFGGQLTFAANTDSQGHAAAVITANNIVGSYVVIATAAMVTGSASFSLTNLPPASNMLKFVQQPTDTAGGQVIAPPVKVQIQDSSGAGSNTAGLPIILSLSSGTGTLLGTLVQLTDGTGTATFSDLRINSVGPKLLTATSSSQPPALSNPFQITASTPSTITAISGTPQATIVSTPFPMLLQARVWDISGNPVGGATVNFTVPASGPSATFNGPATVTTDINGIVTPPLLTANGTVGSFAVTASVSGTSSPATFSLTNLPSSGTLSVAPSEVSFISEINQPAPPAQVQVSSSGGVLSWTTSASAPWIIVSPTGGSTPSRANIFVNPAGLPAGNYSGSVVFSSSTGGTAAVLVTYTINSKPALVITPPAMVFTATSTTITPPAQTLTTSSSAGPISYSVTAQVATPTRGTWLKVSPASGQTAGSVQVSVDLTGLSKGTYNGSVLFTPGDSSINSVAVPVSLLVACGQGGCTDLPATILSVVNGASFHPGGAPRAIMTIFGTNLADGIYQAATYPLPTQLGPTSVTVNGSVVPLYYASPSQLNFQMPSSAPADSVQVAVINGSSGLKTALGQTTQLTAVQPGLFVSTGNRAAALNQDLTVHTPATPVPAGGYILLYTTGGGPISPPLPDGTAAPASPPSLLTGNVQVTIGTMPAQVTFAGAAPGFAGLSQINVIIPAGLAAGDQPVFISVNGVPSNAGLITLK
jgi:adhesin/invasin